MEDTAKRFCSVLFDVFEHKGIKDIVCSPGSRNVPLLIAASKRTAFRKHFVVDERSAAFIGLGMALVSKTPVILLCTSGTALLNYAPAIAEAYYQNIPLIVVSADRPIQWIDQDDSQTIRQNEALGNFVKASYSIPAYGEDDNEMLWYVNRIANDAIETACMSRKGPVHINVHLSEPLNSKIIKNTEKPRLIHTVMADSIGNKEVIKNFALELAQTNVMLVAGFNPPDSKLQKTIAEFSNFPNVVVMAETISNLHLKDLDYSVDSVLTAYDNETLDKYAPNIVISIGGALISRKLKEYLRRNSNRCSHWVIGHSHTTSDPFMSLSLKIETDVTRFFKSINSGMKKIGVAKNKDNFNALWRQLRTNALKVKNDFIYSCNWSELLAFETILNSIPANYNLFLSNGTAVRYAQIIKYRLPHASYCNRGVSGIDGSVSSAIGGAIAFRGNTLLICGDLSFSYDIGALNFRNTPENFKIIVIDNQGGGIFRFIPSTSSLEEREEYLCQKQILPLHQLCEGYGWDYFECDNEYSMKRTFNHFLNNGKKSIMKIVCPGVYSSECLKKYMALKS